MQGETAAVERVFREEYGRLIAALVRRFGDIDIAEEAAGEALVTALEKWPESGVPPNPGGWLTTTAGNRAIDRIRRDRTLAAKTKLLEVAEAVIDEPALDDASFEDERLELLFTCCHPALSTEAQVALTLRTLGGLSTPEIARAFLVPEATMAQRISRAKRTVADVRFDAPGDLATVQRVLYLVFNEGYGGDVDLVAEAIRLTRQLATMTDDPEVNGLLALMLLHHARRPARTRSDGSLVSRTGFFEPGMLVERIPLHITQTPATRVGAIPQIIAIIATLIGFLVALALRIRFDRRLRDAPTTSENAPDEPTQSKETDGTAET